MPRGWARCDHKGPWKRGRSVRMTDKGTRQQRQRELFEGAMQLALTVEEGATAKE